MSGNNQEDLAVLLTNDTLELVRVQGIFLVFSIALFSFSSKGKVFSIISLLISFAINVTLVINYYMERHRIAKLGFYPKRIIEIIAVIMVIVALLTLWILYEVWKTPQATSISKIAEDIESKIDESNKVNAAQLNENLKQIEDNRKLIESLNGNKSITIGNISNGKRETLKRSLTNKQDLSKILSSDQTQKLSGQSALLKLENMNRNKTIATDSVLAAVA